MHPWVISKPPPPAQKGDRAPMTGARADLLHPSQLLGAFVACRLVYHVT